MYLYPHGNYFVEVEAATQGDVAILLEEVGGQQRNPKGDHSNPCQACKPGRVSQSHLADPVVRMDYLKIAIQCHNCHECNTGRTIDSQHEEVDAAPDLSKHPVLPSHVGVDAEGHTDEEQEVSQNQVQEKDYVGFPGLHAKKENPQGYYASWQAYNDLNYHDNLQEQSP